MIIRILLVLSIATTLDAQPRDAHALADAFVRALVADSLPAFLPITAADDFDRREWYSLRETIDRHRCIVVASHRVTSLEPRGDEQIIRIELDGRGTMENAARALRPLPRQWILYAIETPRGLVLRHAMTAQQEAALRYLPATPAERARILEEESIDGGRDLLPPIIDAVMADIVVAMHLGEEEIEVATRLAKETFDGLEEWFARRGDMQSVSGVLRAASVTVRVRGELPLAIAYAEAALDLATALNDCDAATIAQMALGEALRVSGAVEQGYALLQAAGRNTDSLDDPRHALRALHNYSAFRLMNMQMRDGLRAGEEVAAKAAEYGWRQGEGGALRQLSHLHGDVGELEDAMRYSRLAYTALRDAGNRAWASLALADQAMIVSALGRPDTALGLFETARELALGGGVPGYPLWIAAEYAQALIRAGRIEEAACMIERTEAVVPPHLRKPSDKEAMALWIVAASVAERRGQWNEAFWRASSVLESPLPEFEYEPHLVLGRVLRRLGRSGEARHEFEDAVAVAERVRSSVTADPLRRARVFARYAESYYELAAQRLDEGDFTGALTATEGIRARAIADALTLVSHDLSAASTSSERRREQQLKQALGIANQNYVAARTRRGNVASAEAAVETARAELERFTTELSVRHGSRLPVASVTISSADLRAILKEDGLAIIAYAAAEDATLAFAVSRGRHGDVEVHGARMDITRAELARRVGALGDSLSARRLDHATKSRAMHDLLVAPLAPWIRDAKTIAVIPDGVLWQLPFHVLLDRSGEPMIARHAMFYAPSITTLRMVAKPFDAAPPSLLALGNPLFDAAPLRGRVIVRDVTLSPLPEATDEVRRIAVNYARHAVYTGAAAEEELFKKEAGRYRVLHLATHGVLHDRWPMYSAVLLAPSDDEDGVVEAREILELELNADLAVLSACDTARGSIGAGEGVIGMSWALLMAGCPSAVLSQWKAASASTSELMIEFHRQLARRGRTKAESLRQAQLALRRNPAYRHPFYWAPFILVGAGR